MQLKSIAIKIILLFIVIIIVTMTIEGFVEYFSKAAELNKNLNQKMENLPHDVAIVIRLPFWNFDKETVKDLLVNYMDDREIFGIKITETGGDTFLELMRDAQGKIITGAITRSVIEKQALLTARADLKNDEDVIGLVEVFITKTYLQAATRQVIINMLLKIFLLSVFATISLALLLKKILLRQLLVLSSKFREIAEGEGDLTFQLETKTKDELGSLAVYFNKFIKHLSALIKNTKSIINENKQLGEELFVDTDQVAASIAEISAIMNSMNQKNEKLNQELVKTKDAVTQVGSFVNKAVAMIDEQSSSVTQSSSAVE
jgi:methyl-accepting chemotaxis protein